MKNKRFIFYLVILFFGFISQLKAAVSLTTTDYISIPDSTSLNITGSGLTLSIWVSTTASPASASGLISKIGAGNNTGYALTSQGASFRFTLGCGTAQILTGTGPGFNGIGNWHMITATYDGTTMRIYEDGVQDPSTLVISSSIASSVGTNVQIGRRTTTAGYLGGYADDAIILNYALTSEQIQKMYLAKSYAIATPCSGHWYLNEGKPNTSMIGTTFFDVCGNGNNGTAGSQTGAAISMIPTILRYR